MIFFYHLFRVLYSGAIHIAALWNSKAGLWVKGRTRWKEQLLANWQVLEGEQVIWMHCASLGEFEQGRPVLESIRKEYPTTRILLTFFSPSGYEIRKNYPGADWVMYLPFDSKTNARAFLDLTQPSFVIFVKYEFWHFYLLELKRRNIKTILISGIFRSSQPFFQWWGGFHRNMLDCFSHIFVQNTESKKLLDEIGFGSHASVAGDTRFDRVLTLVAKWKPVETIAQFSNKKILVAGSTWREDEELLSEWFQQQQHWQMIIAPHEIKQEYLNNLAQLFPDALFLSKADTAAKTLSEYKVLIIDSIGLLSRLYHYATVAYVGGGFNKSGHHNILEAAVYKKAVITGPRFEKFKESVDLKMAGGSFCIANALELNKVIVETDLVLAGEMAGSYVIEKAGATSKIMDWIQENRLFTKE